MIFPRSHRRSNASWAMLWLIGTIFFTGVLGTGCVSVPSVPANVILRDVHNNGYALAFDDKSQTLASGGAEGHIRLWRLPDGKELYTWKAHSDSLQGLKFLNQDHELLSAGYDGTLARWTRDGLLLQRISTPAPIISIAVDESSELIVTGHRDGHVRLWDLKDFSLISDIHLHRGAVRAVAYHAESQQLASSGKDGSVFSWRLDEASRPLQSPPTVAWDLAFSPDGTSLMGSGWFNLFRWNLDDDVLRILRTAHHGLIISINFSHDGSSLASIGNETDSAVYLLNAWTGDVLKRFQPHEQCGTYVRLSRDGHYLASTSDDANVHIWDLQHLLPEQKFYQKKNVFALNIQTEG